MRSPPTVAWRRPAAWTLAALGVALLFAWTYLDARLAVVDFFPLNGTFQNYNLLRRIGHGQTPCVDFQTYLGLGVTYAMAWVMGSGQTLGDSLFATRLVCGGTFIGCVLLLGRLARLPRVANLGLATVLVMQGTGLGPKAGPHMLVGIIAMFRPGNSVLGLRAALPFGTAAFLLLLGRLRVGQRLLARPIACAALCGALAGLQLAWSNDYGLAATAALYAVYMLWLARLPRSRGAWRPAAARTLVFGATTAVIGLLCLAIATHGHILNWFDYNFRGVAADQFWYFQGHKLMQLTDVPAKPMVLWSLVTLGILLREGFVRPTAHPSAQQLRTPLLAFILLATIIAGYVSSTGSLNSHYFVPAELVTMYTALLFTRRAWRAWRRRRPVSLVTKLCVLLGARMVLSACVLAALCAGPIAQRTAEIWQQGATPSDASLITVPELGGSLTARFDKMVALGRELHDTLREVPPTQRLFSTYASALDVIAGATHPTPYDYIIHALGPTARAAYTQTLQEQPPLYATTLRETYTPWETWLRRVNWDFYRVLLAGYRPVDQTFYNTLWERHPGGVVDSWGPVDCVVQRDQPSRQILTLTYPQHRAIPWGQVRIVEVELTYRAAWRPNRFVHGGLRQLQRVQEVSTARTSPFGDGVDEDNTFGLAPAAATGTTWRFAVEAHPDLPAVVRIEAEPMALVESAIDTCVARDVTAKSSIDAFALRRLHASSKTDAAWRHGIATGGPTAFYVSDASDLRGLRVGQRIQLPHAGWRTVLAIADHQVSLDGAPLDPQSDGYPHPLMVEAVEDADDP